jgi:hypothetical protein
MTPDHSIARIEDPHVREAILTVRSEFFTNLNGINVKVDTVIRDFSGHTSVCDNERRADEQWRSSAWRVLNEFKEVVGTVQATQSVLSQRIDSQANKAMAWVIGILVTVVLSSWGIIWKLLLTAHQ